MALKVPRGIQLLKDGYKLLQGVDEAVLRNIEACKQLAELVKTSYGPQGMNKLIINHLEKLFVTNDAATIMKELEVAHPAAKLLVLASQQQEHECGDHTNWVVILGGELLAKAEYLLRMGLHPADVVEGFDLATKHALTLMEEMTCEELKEFKSIEQLARAVRPTISSKQFGYDGFLSQLVAKACLEVMPTNPKNFNVDSVRVVKILGGSIYDSQVVRGMVFNREPEGEFKSATKAKVAIFTCALDIQQTETKGTVLLKSANELLNFSKGEEKQLESMLKEIVDAGVKVVVSGSAVGDLALHFLNRMGIVVLKILSKFELRRLCKVTGATALTRVGAPMAEEMGFIDHLETIEIGSDRCTVFRQSENSTKTATVVLRGSTLNLLDDLERAIDDGVNTLKSLTKSPKLVAGAGAFEIELARRLAELGEKTAGVASHGVKAYAEALEVIPRTLADNAGMDATAVVSSLYAAHAKGEQFVGVDVESDETIGLKNVVVNPDFSILDAYNAKFWALKLASDAALTVLRIDQIIMSKPAGGPKMPKGGNQFDEDD